MDYLKSVGQANDYTSRSKLATQMGIQNYTGSATQNTQLLDMLRKGGGGFPAGTTVDQLLQSGYQEGDVVSVGGQQVRIAPDGSLVSVNPDGSLASPTTTPTTSSGTPITSTATNTLQSLGLGGVPSTSDLVDQVLNSSEYKLYTEKLGIGTAAAQAGAASAKALLKSKFGAEKASLEQKLAENGLAFSGIRNAQVKGLIDSLASAALGEDRALAVKLLNADVDLKGKVMDLVADLVKEAQDGQKQAISLLNQQGLTINPFTGALTPTFTAQKELAIEERYQQSQEATQRRFEESQAAVTARFEQVQSRLEQDKNTTGESRALAYDNLKVNASKDLLNVAISSTDKYTDPNKYLSYRNTLAEVAPTYLDDFDKTFAMLLNPSDAQRIGIVQPDAFEVETARMRRESGL